MKWILQYTRNARGVTLVEILASLVILSVILVVFVPLFGHSMTSTKVSEDMLDATYVAQTTMEELHQQMTTLNETSISSLKNITYLRKDTERYYYKKETSDAYIEISIKAPVDGLSSVLVKVYPNSGKSKLLAQMETINRWGKTP